MPTAVRRVAGLCGDRLCLCRQRSRDRALETDRRTDDRETALQRQQTCRQRVLPLPLPPSPTGRMQKCELHNVRLHRLPFAPHGRNGVSSRA